VAGPIAEREDLQDLAGFQHYFIKGFFSVWWIGGHGEALHFATIRPSLQNANTEPLRRRSIPA
jgi:hypothetical protein